MFHLRVLFLLGIGALGSSVSQQSPAKPLYSLEDAEYHFNEFLTTHNRIYSTESEKQRRFDIFKQTLVEINEKSSDPHETATFGITKFSDLTDEEFIRFFTGFVPSGNNDETVEEEKRFNMSMPDSFDWREHNAVSEVKYQGHHCSSCWAFSTTGAVEGAYAIKHKKLVSLSEEQLVECDKRDSNCSGGTMQNALQYIIDAGGLVSEQDYPYTSRSGAVGKCKLNKERKIAQVASFTPLHLQNKDEETLKRILISSGPVAIAIAGHDLKLYIKGIINNCHHAPLSHGVLLVGYGEDRGTPYWIIKNSWGTTFGEKGYFRVKLGVNSCGMLNHHATSVLAA